MVSAPTPSGFRAAVAARVAPLSNRSFAALVAGRATSALGDGLYGVAVMWLVYDLTGSTAYTGLAGFLAAFPTALQAFVGPLADRVDGRRALVAVELLQAGAVLAVPVAAVAGHLSVWVVLATIPPLSIGTIVATPVQYAALPRLVDDDDLVRANGLFRAISESAAALSRGLAGVAIAALGVTALYAADAVTFLLAAVAFRWATIPNPASGDGEDDPESEGDDDGLDAREYWREFREGIALLGDSDAGVLLGPSLLANFLFGVAVAVLPAFADAVGGPTAYGLLLAGLTVGSVVGATAAGFVDHVPLWLLGVVGFGLSGLLWTGSVVLAGVGPLPGAVVAAALFGASRGAFRVFGVSLEATFQTAVPEDLVGRVMAAASGATSLVHPLGTLAGGVAGTLFGARPVMLAGGVGALLAGLAWAVHPTLRGFEPPTAVDPGQFGA